MKKNSKILLIEKGDPYFITLREILGPLGFSSFLTAEKDVSIYELESIGPEFAILGPSLDLETCLKCLHRIRTVSKTNPILVIRHDEFLSDHPEHAPFDGVYGIPAEAGPEQISDILRKALKFQKDCNTRTDFPVLIGQSAPMTEIREKILNVADKDVPVLITGESGTGKEMIARSIHYHSSRNRGPLVKVNCVALPDELLESEVFGYQKGAFTDAYKDKPGRLELAHRGTLFIDEIGDLSLSLQAKFLQLLEDKAFSRLGATLDHVIDVRVVAATNSDLWRMVREGTFRKDLYYRLDVINIEAPPLRERKEDIPLLTHFFLNKYCFEYRKETLDAPDEIIKCFMAYHWPGNVRQFQNVIRMAIALRNWDFVLKELDLIKNGDTLAESDSLFSGHSGILAWNEGTIKGFIENRLSLKEITRHYTSEIEREAILKTLKETDWNVKKASEVLRVGYKTLRNRIDEFDLRRG